MTTKKVLDFSLGSKFYFQRGNYYYYKNNMDKALRFYRRAIDVDPANPVNHFNLACLLSEMEQYSEANRLFQQLLDTNSELNESLFWLAMNCGQQQQYRKAYQYLRQYLDREPGGDYSEQAREILTYLQNHHISGEAAGEAKTDRLCNRGVELINQGKIQAAIRCFDRASRQNPDRAAPRNNLALSWFYTGQVEQAVDLTREVLAREPENIYANCNLALFYYALDDQLGTRRQLVVLGSLSADDHDDLIKLGTTFGLLGYHRQALDKFCGLLDSFGVSFEILLLAAVAAHNCGLADLAREYFACLNKMEPDNPYRDYAAGKQWQGKRLPYHLRLPQPVLARLLEGKPRQDDWQALLDDSALWRQLVWVIKQASAATRRRLAGQLADCGRRELLDAVGRLVWSRELTFTARRELYTVLAQRQLQLCLPRFWPENNRSPNANKVLALALARIRRRAEFAALARGFLVWECYCSLHRPAVRNVELWALALEVFVCDSLELLPQRAHAAGIAASGLRRAVDRLTGVCLNSREQ